MSGWQPETAAAGTELMLAGLKSRLGDLLGGVSLRVNQIDKAALDGRPLIVWFQHDKNQFAVQWLQDRSLVRQVAAFVFVSYWQRQRFLDTFKLPPERCVVLRNAAESNPSSRSWEPGPVWRFAYASTPFRGLSVLLDAWDILKLPNAELHIWSSMKLYMQSDDKYEHLYARARATPGVTYHGLAPNPDVRAAFRTMHFLAYPSTFAETSCVTAIEAMTAGCRVIVPSLGALPETTCDYAYVYPSQDDPAAHARVFADTIRKELATPWNGNPALATMQQAHCAAFYSWDRRIAEWKQLIESVTRSATKEIDGFDYSTP